MSVTKQKKQQTGSARVREQTSPSKGRPDKRHEERIYVGAAMALILVFVTLVRVRLAPVPLERDEGEYAYAGQLILRGILPFVEVYNMKMPGIYAAYAAILAIFGQTHVGVHLGLLAVNLATILLLFFVARRVFDAPPRRAVLAAAAYAVLSVGEDVLGAFAHATHFVVLFALAGILVLPREAQGGSRVYLRLVASGLLLGIAFMMKQHGAAFVAFAGLYVLGLVARDASLSPAGRVTRLAAFAAAAAIPFVATCGAMAAAGVFDRFWFWTFTYASDYVSQVSPTRAPFMLGRVIWGIVPQAAALWGLAVVGAVSSWRDKTWPGRLLRWFAAFSFLATCPGFYFREHYFVLVLPAVSIYAGLGAVALGRKLREQNTTARSVLREAAAPILMAAACAITVVSQWDYFFTRTPEDISRSLYGLNPFVESIPIASYIRERTQPEDTIAVMGSEPQIPFYAGRRSASGFCYLYPLMENHPNAEAMQEQMIAEIEAANPKYVVLVMVKSSWRMTETSPSRFAKWVDNFLKEGYEQVGLVDLIAKGEVYAYWDRDARDRKPRIPFSWVGVFVRRAEADQKSGDEKARESPS